MRALYPGSFDPVTFGHLDLIQRASGLFDVVIVAVLRNPNKEPCFPLEQRLMQLTQATSHLPQVKVTSFEGLTVDFALQQQARVILRGLRALSDFFKTLRGAFCALQRHAQKPCLPAGHLGRD